MAKLYDIYKDMQYVDTVTIAELSEMSGISKRKIMYAIGAGDDVGGFAIYTTGDFTLSKRDIHKLLEFDSIRNKILRLCKKR